MNKKASNGKTYKAGIIRLPNEISEKLNWESQDVGMLIFEKDAKLDKELVRQKLHEYKSLVEVEKCLEKLKKNMNEEEFFCFSNAKSEDDKSEERS